MSSEFFIVLSRPVQEFPNLIEAELHKRDLQRHVPDVEHKVYRCKRWLVGAHHFPKMVALLADIVRDGLTPANLERARIVLVTVDHRGKAIKVIPRPEYQPPTGGRLR